MILGHCDRTDLARAMARRRTCRRANRNRPRGPVCRARERGLAFVAALQHLPGTQRCVDPARRVGFPSAEVARILDTTPTAVNSAPACSQGCPGRMPEKTQRAELDAIGKDGQRELVDAFMTAWERADVAALVELLALDMNSPCHPCPLGSMAVTTSVVSSPSGCSPDHGGSWSSARTVSRPSPGTGEIRATGIGSSVSTC